MKKVLKALKEQILLCDGAMGTMLQEGGLPAGACPEEAVLTRQKLIRTIHEEYVAAGAEIVETNTFGANRFKLADYSLTQETSRINREAARLARMASKGKAYVAGSIGPLGKQIAPLGDISFDEAVEAFREQMEALASGGVDMFFLETISDIREGKAALIAAREFSTVPVIAHMTFDKGQRTFTGTPPEVGAVVLAAMGAAAVGANCSTGPEEVYPVMEVMVRVARCYLSVLPNAGLPEVIDGKTVFRKSPESMADFAERFAQLGVNIIGGCCGTTPAHIKAMAAAIKGKKAIGRSVPKILRLCSRTRMVSPGPDSSPLVVGERINLSVRKRIAEAFIADDAGPMLKAAAEQVQEGAHLLDISVGVNAELLGRAGTTEEAMMAKALRTIQSSVGVPLVIDSSNPRAIEVGLRECEGRPLINSVPAEADRMERLLDLASGYGAAVVVLPISEKGIPETAAGRLKLAEEVRAKALKAGIQPEDILIDPLVLAASASQDQLPVTLQTLRELKQRGYQTILGLSNVSFGLPERGVLNSAFLAMAVAEGLDVVILNPADERVMSTLSAARVLTVRDSGGKEFISRFRAAPVAPAPGKAEVEVEEKAISERISTAILSGNREGIVKLVEEALRQGLKPIDINLSVLTPALEEVGKRFEKKEIFLPQMILAAETVQNAFGRLKRAMKGEKMSTRGRIIMATVRGDVHDIGKNICCTVLENHGYEIIDLGRNVPAEVIAENAAREAADIVGLSALMTTTMTQMEVAISELRRRGLKQRVMVGGAVVTSSFAKRIGADGYARDVSEVVKLVRKLMKREKNK